MDLSDFLLARIAEDEAVATTARERNLPFWVAQEMGRSGGSLGQDYVNRFSPARVLAECDAKRRLVEELARMLRDEVGWDDIEFTVMGYLALPYADHPDYRAEWKP